MVFGAVSSRINVIAANTTSEEIHIMFATDKSCEILSALRSISTSTLPRLKLIITYKSLSGANYVLEHTYLLDIREEAEDQNILLKNWHTSISSAPVEEKETLETLKRLESEEKRDEVFRLTQKIFDEKLMDGEELIVDMVEIPQKFSIKCVTDEVFTEIMENHQYGRYVGNRTRECVVKEQG